MHTPYGFTSAAAPAAAHARQDELHGQRRSADGYLDRAPPVVMRDVGQRTDRTEYAGVVDQERDWAELALRLGHDAAHEIVIGHVPGPGAYGWSVDRPGRRLERFARARDHPHHHPRPPESAGHGQSEAAARAGDQRCLHDRAR